MYRIGIDLGGTNIAVGVVDDRHRIVAEASVPTGAPTDGNARLVPYLVASRPRSVRMFSARYA